MKCQIYPSMQLGGTPPQLYDQARDGVVDIVWTLPGYTAGRFPRGRGVRAAVHDEQPRSHQQGGVGLRAEHDAAEFKDVQPLAFHVHGPGVFHMIKKPIKTLADLKGTEAARTDAPDQQDAGRARRHAGGDAGAAGAARRCPRA